MSTKQERKPAVVKGRGHQSDGGGFAEVIINGKTYLPEDVVSAVRAYRAVTVPPEQPTGEGECDMGVGCKEAGVCYAAAHGHPERCSLAAPPPPLRDAPTNPGEISSKVVDAPQQFHHDECQCVECDDGNPETNRHAALAAPTPAEPLRDAGAVYQLECDGDWFDVDVAGYYGHDGSNKRILYTHPAPAQVDEGAVERIAALLYTEATDEPWTVGGDEYPGPDRPYYRGLARRVIALTAAAKEGK